MQCWALHRIREKPVMASASVDSISPSSGPADGNSTVIITGVGFAGVTSVAFGPLAASDFTVDSDSQITALSPPADFSGAALVRVTSPAGTSDPNPATQFTYLTDVPVGNWNPPAGINRVKVWLNAFIPHDVPGKTETV